MSGNGFGVLSLTMLLAASVGCVSERCYENYQCPSPKVCSSAGRCVYECSGPADCISGYSCVDHLCRADLPADVVDSVEPRLYCPAGMVLVEKSFCIDIYEAARPDSTSTSSGLDESRAVSRKGAMPWMTKDNAVAEAACEASEKRLCRPAEWTRACSGPDGTVYSYGDDYEPETCNGIDAFGRQNFHLTPTGSFPECVNEYGVFDMNGNVWEHVLGGGSTDVRGGAYNCSDSRSYHRCSYVPGNWQPSALGFRCCKDPLVYENGAPETAEIPSDVIAADDSSLEIPELPAPDLKAEDICSGPDSGTKDEGGSDVVFDQGPTDAVQDVGLSDIPDGFVGHDAGPDQGPADVFMDSGADAGGQSCPIDMVLVSYQGITPFCMDRYEAARSDSTSTSAGVSNIPVSEPGRQPWYSSTLTLAMAKTACAAAGKRVCVQDEWIGSCTGNSGNVYVYGNDYDPSICNSIDTFCYCDTTCAGVAECPYPHCRVSPSPAGDGGPCGAGFHVAATGSFPFCVNEWGVYDVNGNVWEVTDAGDGVDHFRGGAYNCSDSEALHRCDHDGNWGPSAKGFRCCMDAKSGTGD